MIRSTRLGQLALGFLALLAGSASLPAADLLYVSQGSGKAILTYDTTGNNGATIAATLSYFAGSNLDYAGMAFDSTGNLYAANYGNDTISKYSSSGASLGKISANLSGPFGLAFDSSGNLYAANSNNSSNTSPK